MAYELPQYFLRTVFPMWTLHNAGTYVVSAALIHWQLDEFVFVHNF